MNGRFNSETEVGSPLQAIRRPSQHGHQSAHRSRGFAFSNTVRGGVQTQPQPSDKTSEVCGPSGNASAFGSLLNHFRLDDSDKKEYEKLQTAEFSVSGVNRLEHRPEERESTFRTANTHLSAAIARNRSMTSEARCLAPDNPERSPGEPEEIGMLEQPPKLSCQEFTHCVQRLATSSTTAVRPAQPIGNGLR